MQVNNLPDLVNAAVNSDGFGFADFHTREMGAREAKECVLAIGEWDDFHPDLVVQVIDEIADLDPQTLFVLAHESSMSLYVSRSKVPVAELVDQLRGAGADSVDSGESVPELDYCPVLARAWWY